ncbi:MULTISPECIES: class I SAM-dependent methyltransferase [Streptomyces]|uniref:class I SAM-dependent methyltransferase n=1 Tax=Streptomyces TaxID=1883 RepID=UPI002B06240F|nr:class I SAM-dependent methyltransferase [Streptomyces sp. JHD 1]
MTMLRRFKDFTIELDLHRDSFIDAPRAEQKRWVVHRAVDELAEQLRHLDVVAPDFVAGTTRGQIGAEWHDSRADYHDGELLIEGQQVMQDWEEALMRRMAERVGATHGDVLEIGFGLGLSATFIEEQRVRSHTIVEFNDEVLARARRWAAERPGADIELIQGNWQQVLPELGDFDGVFWDAFPTSEEEFDQYVLRDSAVAEAFFCEAAAHLRPGGVFTYYTNERDSLSRRHQRSLLRYFSSFSVEVVDGLVPPPDCQYWWTDRMTVVTATR